MITTQNTEDTEFLTKVLDKAGVEHDFTPGPNGGGEFIILQVPDDLLCQCRKCRIARFELDEYSI